MPSIAVIGALGRVAIEVLSSGIDTLHVSARGDLRATAIEVLDEGRRHALETETQVPIEFPVTGQSFLVKPFGLRGYTFWLTSPDFELVVGKGERFPAALIQLHSAYLHSCGLDLGWNLVALLLARDLFWGRPDVVVSRIDLYVDFQGWKPTARDLSRFVCQARQRRVFVSGRQLTGFMFGKGGLVARLYDKTEEARKRGATWLGDLWSGGDRASPVWRLEFQFRRPVLNEFHLKAVDEVVASLQDLWTYGSHRWLSLRRPTGEKQVGHWPEDPVWDDIKSVLLAPSSSGIVRKRIEEVTEERIVRGLMGYATSLAALHGVLELPTTFTLAQPLVLKYLARRKRSFHEEVTRKKSRLMNVTAPLGDSFFKPWPGQRLSQP